jgi:hypothetical protein
LKLPPHGTEVGAARTWEPRATRHAFRRSRRAVVGMQRTAPHPARTHRLFCNGQPSAQNNTPRARRPRVPSHAAADRPRPRPRATSPALAPAVRPPSQVFVASLPHEASEEKVREFVASAGLKVGGPHSSSARRAHPAVSEGQAPPAPRRPAQAPLPAAARQLRAAQSSRCAGGGRRPSGGRARACRPPWRRRSLNFAGLLPPRRCRRRPTLFASPGRARTRPARRTTRGEAPAGPLVPLRMSTRSKRNRPRALQSRPRLSTLAPALPPTESLA